MIEEASPMTSQDDGIRAEMLAEEQPDETVEEETPEEKEEDPTLSNNEIKVRQEGKLLEIIIPDYTIRGQLGKLITNELNKIYQNKPEENLKNLEGIRIQVDSGDGQTLVKESYIYLTDIKELNKTHGRILLDQLVPATEQYKETCCLIRLNKHPEGMLDLAIETLSNMNVRFFYHPDDLIRYIGSIYHD